MIKKSEHQTLLPFMNVIIESQRYEQREAETSLKRKGLDLWQNTKRIKMLKIELIFDPAVKNCYSGLGGRMSFIKLKCESRNWIGIIPLLRQGKKPLRSISVEYTLGTFHLPSFLYLCVVTDKQSNKARKAV